MSHFSESKKWSAAIIGVAITLFIFTVTVAGVCTVSSDKSAHLVSLAQICIVAVTALLSTMVGGQSCVDWKHGSSNRFAQETKVDLGDGHKKPNVFDDEQIP